MSSVASRPAVCADDRWYPASANELSQAVEGYINQADVLDVNKPVIGLIAPHAGYFFSGHVAGAAYRQVQGDHYDTVVLVGPDHRGAAQGSLAVPDFQMWSTPLGDLPVDSQLLDMLAHKIHVHRLPHDNEHALEVQLPFLQLTLKQFTLLPIMVGSQSFTSCSELGEAIAEVVADRKALLVASTDLSHFLPDDETRKIDRETLRYILDFDPEGLSSSLARSEASACGGGPVAAVMIAARKLGAKHAELASYATSGDVWKDKNRVVGYAAVVLTP